MQTAQGGKTAATIDMVTEGLEAGTQMTFLAPTGSGRSYVTARVVDRWKAAVDDRVAIVVAVNGTCAQQWNRHDVDAIGRMAARMEVRRKGTVLGHDPARVGLVVIEDSAYGPSGDVEAIKALFPVASFLLTGSPSPAPIMADPVDVRNLLETLA